MLAYYEQGSSMNISMPNSRIFVLHVGCSSFNHQLKEGRVTPR